MAPKWNGYLPSDAFLQQWLLLDITIFVLKKCFLKVIEELKPVMNIIMIQILMPVNWKKDPGSCSRVTLFISIEASYEDFDLDVMVE